MMWDTTGPWRGPLYPTSSLKAGASAPAALCVRSQSVQIMKYPACGGASAPDMPDARAGAEAWHPSPQGRRGDSGSLNTPQRGQRSAIFFGSRGLGADFMKYPADRAWGAGTVERRAARPEHRSRRGSCFSLPSPRIPSVTSWPPAGSGAGRRPGSRVRLSGFWWPLSRRVQDSALTHLVHTKMNALI